MPIRPEIRWLYPIDWRELSIAIRFGRAGGRCEGCGRPHGRLVVHLGDGWWWDAERGAWRGGEGRMLRGTMPDISALLMRVRTTRVVLATAHRRGGSDMAVNPDIDMARSPPRASSSHSKRPFKR